jgi:hypothetical protein
MFIISFKSHLSFAEFVKCIIPFCPNIHTLKLRLFGLPEDLDNEIVRLNKLKELDIETGIGTFATEEYNSMLQHRLLFE